MFIKLRKVLASFLIVLILFPTLTFAQASQTGGESSTSASTPGALATGAHPLGSYGGSSFDQVNLFNGNLSMSFPLAALGGRAGSGTGISLSYNSKIWTVEQKTLGNPLAEGDYYIPRYEHWDKERPILAPGWSFHVGRMMGRHSSWKEDQTGTKYALTRLTFSAPDGTEYNFRDDLTDGQPLTPTVIGNNQSRGKRFHTADGTSAIFVSDTEIFDYFQPTNVYLPFAVDGVVILRNGTRFIISKGKVKEQHDSDGNIVRYAYQGSRLTQITDTLGRQINIQYVEATPNPTNEDLFNINITSPGFGNSTRTTSIKFAPLANSLVSQGGSYTQAEVLKTYVNRPGIPDSGLFPNLDPPSSANDFFNPNVIKEISLPSGHKWKFRYNSYGEVVLVETPNLGAIEYRMEQSDGPIIAGSVDKQEIFRRVSARRVWPKAADRVANLAPESKSTYSDPSLTDSNHIPLPVRQRTFSGESTRVASSNHYYNYSPLENFAPGTGVPPKSNYSPWLEGKEIKTEELTLDTEQPKRVTEYTWEQRAGVSWIPGSTKTFLAQPENDPRIKETTVRYLDSGQVFRTVLEYQDNVFINGVGPFGYNNVISESVFDGANLLRKTTRTFITDPEYLKYNDDPLDKNIVINPHLVSLVQSESVLSPTGAEETRVEYEYDNYSRDPLVNRTFAVATSHNPNYGTNYLKRGNVTAVTAGLGNSPTQTDRTTVFSQYDIAGNAVKSTGPKANQIVRTDYDSQHFAFPIASRQSIPENPIEFKAESIFDVSTGLVTQTKDFNNQIVSYFYQDPDLLDRITKVVRPTGSGETRYTYSSPGIYPAFVKVDTSLDNGRDLSAISYVDGFLKPLQQTSKDVNNDFVAVETFYDGLGRVKKATNPHRLGVVSSPTDGYTTTTYDELGRISTINTFDGTNNSTGTVTSTYSGTTVTVADQASKQRRSKVDALGRLTEVIEPAPDGNLTQSTTYDYDARGNLKQVHQGQQTRTFVYDSLSRLLTSTTPEIGANGNGTTSYEYDIVSNLTKRTDPRGIVTTYTYDTLNRLLTRSYSDTTPAASYFYDGNLPPGLAPAGFTPQFAMGRVTAVTTAATTREQATGLFHTYDNVGRITQSIQLLDGQYYTTNSLYNLASLPTSHTYPSGRVVNHSYNIAGQLTDVMSNGQPISQQASYTAAGAIESHKLGNGLYHQIAYNSRLQPTQITLGSSLTGQTSQDKWKLEYSYSSYDPQNLTNANSSPTISTDTSHNNGNIGYIKLTPGLGKNPIEQFFAYDELNRLKVAKEFVTPPNAPTGLKIEPNDSYYFPLSWDDNSDNESGFIIERSRDGQPYEIIGYAFPNQNIFFDTPTGFNTPYCYRVRAFIGDTNFSNLQNAISSDYSNLVCATTGPQPPDPCEECQINPDPVICDCCDADGCISIRKRIGNGLPGYKGDSKLAIDAQLFGVSSVSIASNGEIFLADTNNKVIRKVDNNQIISTVVGNGKDSLSSQSNVSTNSVSLATVPALTTNPQTGEMFFLSNNIVSKFNNSTNKLSVVAGNGKGSPSLSSSAKDSNLGLLSAIDFDNQGNLYTVSQTKDKLSQVFKIDSTGKIISILGKNTPSSPTGNVKDSSFSTITAFAVDKSNGDIYFVESSQPIVKKISAKSGDISNFFGGGKEQIKSSVLSTNVALDQTPTALLVSPSGTLYIATSKAGSKASIYTVNPDLTFKLFAGGQIKYPVVKGGDIPVSLVLPKGLALDKDGNLFVADSSRNQVLFLSKAGSKTSSSQPSSSASTTNEPNISPLVGGSTVTNWSESYTYDRYGNRTEVTGTNPQTLDISTSTNRITSSGYTYDEAGNVTSDPSGKFYFYDAENRLINFSFDPQGSSIAGQYFYDANGWRVKKFSYLEGTTRFVYNQGGTLLAEYIGGEVSSSDSPNKENIYAPSGLLAVIEPSQTLYLTPDHLGSNRVITSSTGNVVTRRDFYPFGQPINNPNDFRISSTDYLFADQTVRQRFTGYEKDPETDLDFAQARYFASNLGRFMQTDPVERSNALTNPQGGNRYAYVSNNPIRFIDPTGLFTQEGKKPNEEIIESDAVLIGGHTTAVTPLEGFAAVIANFISLPYNAMLGAFGIQNKQSQIVSRMAGANQRVNLANQSEAEKIFERTINWSMMTGIGTINQQPSLSAIEELLYGGRVGENLPGFAGAAIPRRPTVVELENLTLKHGVEFAVTYKYGQGPNGSGGQYYLHSGEKSKVAFPLESDRMLIFHTHPEGYGPSIPDMQRIDDLINLKSPQRSSQVIQVNKDKVTRFGSYEKFKESLK